ncbi:MAG: response regulator transcription factor [Acidimicrobiia bacterium]|nr:response regulator transcription factor [Acidimicrobiia bacterium]
MSRLLVVEDEQHLAEGLRFNLEAEGYEVEILGHGGRALEALLRDSTRFDAVVLDVMLPGKDGFAIASELRAAGRYVPILMLTARSRPEDVLRGFEAGADDYVPKPFELAILVARLNGLLRRGRWHRDAAAAAGGDVNAQDTIEFGGRRIDFEAMQVTSGEQAHRLTRMECELLRYLVSNAGKAVSRRAILEEVWGVHEDTDTRAIDNFMVRLRRYLEDDPSSPRFLLTVRGVGYTLALPAER